MHNQNTLPLVELTSEEMILTTGGDDTGLISDLIRYLGGGGQPIE